MIDRPPSGLSSLHFPMQMGGSSQNFQHAPEPDPIFTAAQKLPDHLLVYDNFSVYGLVGDANDPQIQQKISEVKGDRRGLHQPLSWTVPFERAAATIDKASVSNEALRSLIQDPDLLTRRLGGMAFLRATADLTVKYELGIPDSIIPDRTGSTVQIYSPTGNDRTSRLIRYALAAGVEPAMTSANESGNQKEIVDEASAREFASTAGRNLEVLVNQPDDLKRDRPLGSYPVIELMPQAMRIIRTGCFDSGILQRLLPEYELQLAPDGSRQETNYPDNVLRLEDLPPDVKGLEGSDLRDGLMATLGWQP